MAKVVSKRGRGRPAAFETKKAVAAVLSNPASVSTYHKHQLVDAGYLSVVTVKSGGRGRPAFDFQLTSKAKGLLNLAKNWGAKASQEAVTA